MVDYRLVDLRVAILEEFQDNSNQFNLNSQEKKLLEQYLVA